MHIIDRFENPLKNARFETADVIEEWHGVISYAITFLNCSSTNYLLTWYPIFSSKNACKFKSKSIFLVAELAFCLPVSTEKLERSFSIINRMKRDTRYAEGVNWVENLMRNSQGGPLLECFDRTNAMKLRLNHNDIYPTELELKKENNGNSCTSWSLQLHWKWRIPY